MNLLNNDSAVGRGVRTLIQVVVAIVLAVAQVPGVPEAINNVLRDNAVFSVPVIAGVVSVIWNIFRKDVKNI